MEFLQKIVENVGFGKKDEKIDENDKNLNKKGKTRKKKVNSKNNKKSNEHNNIQKENEEKDESYLSKIKNITNGFSFYDYISKIFNDKSNEKTKKNNKKRKKKKKNTNQEIVDQTLYSTQNVSANTTVDLSKFTKLSNNPLQNSSNDLIQEKKVKKQENVKNNSSSNSFLLSDPFGVPYNHFNLSANEEYLSKDTIFSLLQIKGFPCEINEFALSDFPEEYNELSKWESIFSQNDFEKNKKIGNYADTNDPQSTQKNLYSLQDEKVEYILSGIYMHGKYKIPILILPTQLRVMLCNKTMVSLGIYKEVEINQIKCIFYRGCEMILYLKSNEILQFKIGFTDQTFIPLYYEEEKKKKVLSPQEIREMNQTNLSKTRILSILLWRYYFIKNKQSIRVMEITNQEIFQKIQGHISEIEIFFQINLQIKDKILRVIKYKNDLQKHCSKGIGDIASRSERVTLNSKSKLCDNGNYEHEISVKPFDGICYIINADQLKNKKYELVFLKIIDMKYFLIYNYKNEMIIPIDFNSIIAIRISKERFALSIELFKNLLNYSTEKKEFYFKVKKKLMMNYGNYNYSRLILFTNGTDDVNYEYFMPFVNKIIEINKLNPSLLFLRECHTKYIVDLNLKEGQTFFNLAAENKNRSRQSNEENHATWGMVEVRKNRCCCNFGKKKKKDENSKVVQGNQSEFIKTLHPETRKTNIRCTIF